ncbi:peptide deformylase [Niabella ginsengisoli]|uniref:Peptide deformylase-like n=1 Tax=Niabella ginsengisoli TaxID=522298 RepID=A0ABS9SMZ1_9BACT|nr:peptide deformylase [Niabella ginsengisoli]MCH5599768.1 peptide deformylase [Niabella ginsengisoli]
MININAQSFTDAEKKIILGGDTNTMLRVIPLTEPAGAKALKAVSKDISFNDALLPILKRRMLKSVLDSSRRGVGIAAPQVGINRNLIWVQRFDKPGQPFEFYINPKIVWRSSILCQGPEGDLSFEGSGDVIRNFSIMISYTDIQGTQHLEMLEDFSAIIFQHETDHLFGTLFTDRLEEQKNKKYTPFRPVRAKALLIEN